MSTNSSPFATNVTPIVFDIETVGLPYAADYLEPVTAAANLRDPAKIAADVAEKTVARLEKLALDWNVGRVAAIGWQTEEDPSPLAVCFQTEAEEAAGLLEFWSRARHRTLVGFNVKQFDLRFLVQRSRYLRVPHPALDLGKYQKQGIVDLYLDLTFGDGHYDSGVMRRTLRAFAKRFGIPVNDDTTGADMAGFIEAGDWAAVARHCSSDVAVTWALAERLGYVATRELAEWL